MRPYSRGKLREEPWFRGNQRCLQGKDRRLRKKERRQRGNQACRPTPLEREGGAQILGRLEVKCGVFGIKAIDILVRKGEAEYHGRVESVP